MVGGITTLWLSVLFGAVSGPVQAAATGSLHMEKIEWTWSDRPEHPDPNLPNVLLLGDSITRAYYDPVRDLLTGKANVYLYATSVSVGDARLAGQIKDYLTAMALSFDVVHLNNGMHGVDYSEAEYQTYYPDLFLSFADLRPKIHCVIATTTPIRAELAGTVTNARIDRRNEIARFYAGQFGCAIDDQHLLMLAHQDLHSDDVHFTAEGSSLQAGQVAQTIESALPGRAP